MVLAFRVRVVELELVVLDVLGDPVDLELRVVERDARVRHRDDINFAVLRLFFEERAFAHTHADAHLRAADVVKGRLDLSALLADQQVEINVDIAPQGLVLGIPVGLHLLLLLVLAPALLPGGLHLLDVVDHVARAGLVVLFHHVC